MSKKPVPLTDKAVAAAKPKNKPYKLTDGSGIGGLYLEVMPSGSKIWRMKYFHPTQRNAKGQPKENRLTLGKYGTTTEVKADPRKIPIQLARKLAIDAKILIDQGTDPNTKKKREKLQREREHDNSFENLAMASEKFEALEA